MGVYLSEVLEQAGYDIVNNPDDARWFLAQQNEYDDLLEQAEECIEKYEDEEEEKDECY